MRQINVDALTAYIEDYACLPCKKYGADREGIRCEFCGFGFCLDGISRHKAVEAIPIGWIKRWSMKSENTYNREQIVEMLNDWDKENETN